jgi:HlyD family secretion protein
MKNKKRWIWISVIVVIIAVVVLPMILGSGDAKVVTIGKAEFRNLSEVVAASGKVQPSVEVKIQSEVSGQIVELPVKEGDYVQKGQLLVRINPDLYVSALSRAEAALNTAKSNLSSAKARLTQAKAQKRLQETTLARLSKLIDQKAISQAEFDNASSALESSVAEVEAAEESVHSANFAIASADAGKSEAQENLRRTTIVAPISGTVTALAKELGETVLGNNMMSGDVIMKVSVLNEMEIDLEVNETDIVHVQVGDTADVEIDAFSDQTFKGVVTEVGYSALNAGQGLAASTEQVTNFSVKVKIVKESYAGVNGNSENNSPFKPGMSATVKIHTDEAGHALAVPTASVTTRADSLQNNISLTVVFLKKADNTVEMKQVVTGIQDGTFIQITSGLSEGEEIVTGPYELLSKDLENGDAIKLEEKK